MKNKTTVTMILILFVVTVSMSLFSGCTDTINGDTNTNLKPVVQFVNIPPEGQQFSRNPQIFWMGNDPDGLIDYYRYYIAVKSEVDAAGGPSVYSATIADEDWTQIDISQAESDPHTANVLPLTADTINPIENPIDQYIFLQAFDQENLGSDIMFRLFSRIDNPPETQILDIANSIPFVNSVFEGGVVTGVRLRWRGSDQKDYGDVGLTPPPFDFEWRLYGPFPDSTLDLINNTLIEKVFVTEDARVMHEGDEFITCSSIDIDTVINGDTTTIPVEVCDTIHFDAAFMDTAQSTAFYTRDSILNVDSTLLSSKLVTGSFNGVDPWVQNSADTIYNVFRNGAPDTTIEMGFIFWIRSRDDALVKDLTPAFISFPVINPKYERDIAVVDFTAVGSIAQNHDRYIHIDTAKAFWYNIITRWGDSSSYNILFDTAFFTVEENPALALKTGIDYIHAVRYNDGIPLKILLQHKLLILYNENFDKSGFADANRVKYPEILSAMDAGINVWAAWRNPLNVASSDPAFQTIKAPLEYTRYFGVLMMTYSSWFANAFDPTILPANMTRNEDFVGTYSIDESQWPNLVIDTALLHSRLNWHEYNSSPFKPWIKWEDSLAALPEVNWAARGFGTEVMYLYKSKYGGGGNDPNGYEYEGSPVGHRFQSSLFRTVHFNFTLLTIDSLQAQGISNNVLDWLYDPTLSGSVVQDNRYEDALYKISIEDARNNYDERLIEQSLLRQENGN